MMFGNKALVYISTEGELVIKAHQIKDQNNTITFIKAKNKKKELKVDQDKAENAAEFEAMKKKMLKVIIVSLAIVVLAVAATGILKFLQ